jgi:hypothetical protein
MGIDLPLTGAGAEQFEQLLQQPEHEGVRQTMKTWPEQHKEANFHLFAIEIESAALVRYGDGEQSVELWPQGTKFKRPYG